MEKEASKENQNICQMKNAQPLETNHKELRKRLNKTMVNNREAGRMR